MIQALRLFALGTACVLPAAHGVLEASAHHKPGHVGIEVGTTNEGFATGIFIPGGNDGGEGVRKEAARCKGCSWRKVPACDGNGWKGYDPISGVERWEDNAACVGFSKGCGSGRGRWDIYLREPGNSQYHRIGPVCLSVGQEPVSGAAIAAEVRRYLDAVPIPRMHVQPPTAQIVGVPTIFYVDEPAFANSVHSFAGVTVEVRPRASYFWQFGDGGSMGPTDAGARYPDHTISHVYRAPGSKVASVTADWTATFVAFGEQFDLDDSVARTASVRVTVREARAQLEDG